MLSKCLAEARSKKSSQGFFDKLALPFFICYQPLSKARFTARLHTSRISSVTVGCGRIQDEPTVRVIAQGKNSLAPEGKSIAFELDPEHGFQWKGACEITVDELLSGGGQVQTKTMQMEDELKKMLNSGEVSAETIRLRADELGISERTLKIAKKNLGIVSAKRSDQWYWKLSKGVRV